MIRQLGALLLLVSLSGMAWAADPESPTDEVEAALPQTDAVPQNDARVEALARQLFAAIAEDSPEKARAFFFPRAAYRQVKAIADPEHDWNQRLIAAYERDIHALARSLPKGATFVSFDVPSRQARWVLPGEEWNKLGYYRVYGSKLRYVANGQAGSIPIKSLISWRGRWYVVHFSGYK
jgi:hypothetical protein